MEFFSIKDCTLLTRMSGLPPACNLRELRDRLAVCSPEVLYHHFCETLLVPSFDYPDYRNDFAVWARHHLRDTILGERLGSIDPYAFGDIEDLRRVMLDIIDDRLYETEHVPWAPRGHEFYFMDAITIVYDTGRCIAAPRELAVAVKDMSPGSIFFHFFEARRRPPLGVDDFTAWLRKANFCEMWLTSLADIDYFFYTLAEVKSILVEIFQRSGSSGPQPEIL